MDPQLSGGKGHIHPRGGIAIHPFANYADDEHRDMARSRMLASFPESRQI